MRESKVSKEKKRQDKNKTRTRQETPRNATEKTYRTVDDAGVEERADAEPGVPTP
jgi:hypothetical protein